MKGTARATRAHHMRKPPSHLPRMKKLYSAKLYALSSAMGSSVSLFQRSTAIAWIFMTTTAAAVRTRASANRCGDAL